MIVPKGNCPVCGAAVKLKKDGTLFRHFGGFTPTNADGTCTGWGQAPVQP